MKGFRPPLLSSRIKEMTSRYDSRGRVVQVDGLVLLKIIQHATQHFPEYVSGSLLGLDVESTIEITHRFVFLGRYTSLCVYHLCTALRVLELDVSPLSAFLSQLPLSHRGWR